MYPDFIRTIEELGGDVVHDELCQGARYYDAEVVCEAEYTGSHGRAVRGESSTFHQMYHQRKRIENIFGIVEKYRLNGIIFFLPKYCQPDWFQQDLIEKTLRERDIPFLTVETVAGMPEASVRTRLEAFIEMISRVRM